MENENQSTLGPIQYLLDAYRQWALDATGICHIIVHARAVANTPAIHSVKDGVVTLSIGPKAVSHFALHEDHVDFGLRFRGVDFEYSISYFDIVGVVSPMGCVCPITAIPVLNGLGHPMLAEIFPAVEDTPASIEPPSGTPPTPEPEKATSAKVYHIQFGGSKKPST